LRRESKKTVNSSRQIENFDFRLNIFTIEHISLSINKRITKNMRKRKNRFQDTEEHDPISTVANLFDVAMVFAVALMVALVTRYNMTEVFSKEDFTMVKNPGKENMEIITKKGKKIEKYKASEEKSSSNNKGKRIGAAYQLENGEVIYVPD
jgi:hypothetical protein